MGFDACKAWKGEGTMDGWWTRVRMSCLLLGGAGVCRLRMIGDPGCLHLIFVVILCEFSVFWVEHHLCLNRCGMFATENYLLGLLLLLFFLGRIFMAAEKALQPAFLVRSSGVGRGL